MLRNEIEWEVGERKARCTPIRTDRLRGWIAGSRSEQRRTARTTKTPDSRRRATGFNQPLSVDAALRSCAPLDSYSYSVRVAQARSKRFHNDWTKKKGGNKTLLICELCNCGRRMKLPSSRTKCAMAAFRTCVKHSGRKKTMRLRLWLRLRVRRDRRTFKGLQNARSPPAFYQISDSLRNRPKLG